MNGATHNHLPVLPGHAAFTSESYWADHAEGEDIGTTPRDTGIGVV